jgi:iron complex outermembrane receptor protein
MVHKNGRGFKLLKYMILSISLLFSLSSYCQSLNDTIRINEVTINGLQNNTGVKVIKNEINSLVLGNYRQKNLADVISENSVIFIKNYGLGGAATISMRGTGASHTIFTWNGININSPMPGQSDLSLIPTCFIDNVKILYGGSSMVNGNGGFGGIIDLETNPEWKKETSLILNPSIGSFGRYNGSFQVRSGNTSFQTVTKVYLESSENNFRYLNNEVSAQPVLEERKNSQFSQQGYLQELYFKKGNSITSARVWYQSSRRNLPSPIILSQANNGEKQYDESLRTMLSYQTLKGDFKYTSTGALVINR